MENMEIYNKVREVPREAQKAFNNGRFSGTDINPMWRIKTLTESFGMVGFGWYTEILNKWLEKTEDGMICAFVDIHLFVKNGEEWSKPIFGTGGNTFVDRTKNGLSKASDEAYKMAYTDALSVACKALGIGADVYFANDKTKYDNPQPTLPDLLITDANSFLKCVNGLKNGFTITQIKKKWKLSPEVEAELLTQSSR